MVKEKDLIVETLRGLAITLVVIGHVIGSASDGGMQVADNSFMRYFYYTFIECLQMPLFTVIAGWVYALYPIRPGNFSKFVEKKIYRILVPMIVVGVSYFLLQYFTPGTNKKGNLLEIWKLLVFPYTLYWYLYSLFIVFVIVSIADTKKLMQKINGWLGMLIVSFLVLLFRDYFIPIEYPNYLSYKGAIYLLPFFIIGIGMVRFKDIFQQKILILLAACILALTFIIQQLAWFNVIDFEVTKDNLTGLLLGTAGTFLLFNIKLKAKWLIWIGAYSYSIFLFHAFGTAGGRIILKTTGINYTVLIFIISLSFGLLLPVITEIILDKFKMTRFLYLGRPFAKRVNKELK